MSLVLRNVKSLLMALKLFIIKDYCSNILIVFKSQAFNYEIIFMKSSSEIIFTPNFLAF